MVEDRIFLDFNANDYIIRLSPYVDDAGNWTGELLVGTVTTDENDMTDEDHYNLMGITKMVCAAVPAMEEDDYVRDTLTSIVERVEDDTPEAIVDSVKENVINVNFKQKGGKK